MLAETEVIKKRDIENMGTVFLDPDQKSPRAQDFEERLTSRIVGQERAVRRMSGLYQIFLAGMNPPNRPIGTMLFLGPTGSGKTRVIEAAAEVLYGDPNAVVKIDCAEFQHSHEIAKLIGSPPGYLGHRETSPMLTQENLDRMHTDGLIVSGYRYTVHGPAGDAKARSVTQAYLRVTDAVAEKQCFVGGCSGQICSDQEGVISTCEWQPQYACYHDAKCEVQTDGNCGWTQTSELQACLANP